MNEVIESQRGEIYRAQQGDEQLQRDQQLLHEQLLEQNRDLREAHEKSLNEMTHMEYRYTFLQVQRRLLQQAKHQLRIRDASQDRQPKIHSSRMREILQRIMVQTNNDCRFQTLILTNSPHQPRLLAGR